MKIRNALVLASVLLTAFLATSSLPAADAVCPQGCATCSCYQEVKHQGWKALESKRFRIHYSGPKAAAVPLVAFCEETCQSLRTRWIADCGPAWSCKCDVYLYPNARSFERGARAPAEMWGLTDLEIGEGKVWLRRLHMRTDDEAKLKAVMMHEMTHVVLAEHFCHKPIPRWADEGIAVYSEPRERQQKTLTRLKDDAERKRLMPLKQIAGLKDSPQNERESELYYGQSGAVIEYLVTHHKLTEKEVLAFVELCGEQGWEKAIKKTLPETTATKFESDWRDWLVTREEPLLKSIETSR